MLNRLSITLKKRVGLFADVGKIYQSREYEGTFVTKYHSGYMNPNTRDEIYLFPMLKMGPVVYRCSSDRPKHN